MLPRRIRKIDLQKNYPCPSCRKGSLNLIFLTEALGCDRCQKIFVVKDNYQIIEQLSSFEHTKAWYWNGSSWSNLYKGLTPNTLSALLITMVLFPMLMAIFLSLLLQRVPLTSMMLGVIVCFVLMIFVGLMLWIAYRHRT
ncbi:hypothetical protein Xen7305DRAFT_00009870 [Xenococcus sp. PCC 7305]|uniref:hypothetical protein n=1 Tax=Xenococcus sp. PCC 7305 TaxID=102125 RepID=UPI0002ACD83A|nr:hypothetical protein [Xenococcus sp. PCC 7305]ELS01284.1 hypothetical protein Xen7305DRAFT_00009870 [Xenococcus sp. PCC 7305]